MADFGTIDTESWLAAVVDGADDAIVGKDLESIVRSWNPAAERIFGYSAAEMIGSSVLRIIPGEMRDEEDAIIERIRRGEKVDHYETTRVAKDGRRIPVSLTVSPVRDASGHIVGASSIARDVTALRVGEHGLAQLGAIVESSDDAIIGKDLNGVITSWNRAATRLYGYEAQEMIGQPVLRLIPAELEHEEDMILRTIRSGQRVDHHETVRLHKDGSPREVSITVSPIRDRRGEVIGAAKVAREIGARRRAETAAAILAAIVQSSDDAIISKDLKGTVTSWNAAAERLYGYSAEDMIGNSILQVIPPALHAEEENLLTRIFSGEQVHHFETQRLHKDGHLIDVQITVSPVRDTGGRIVGASKIARDVGQQKQAQRRKDEFLAILAHELRNPLAPVRNAVSVLRTRGHDPQHRQKALDIAERQLAHMARLLDDLLDVARLSTGHVELQRRLHPLGDLIAPAVEAARPLMERKQHQFVVKEAPEPLWVDADGVRISQVLLNLLSNAAKYTRTGGRVELEAHGDGECASIAIRDNGIGFEPEAGRHLYQLFSQGNAPPDMASGGLGIGLALVKEFVERHGGTVKAASAGPGRGSTFTIRLPLVSPPEGESVPRNAPVL
jgi:two-component system, OmpR family, sensor histidine kinase VicK